MSRNSSVSEFEFKQEFVKIQPQLKSYLLRIVANAKDAEDLTQDTYLKSVKGFPGFKGDSTLKTWIFSIATNLARDHFRARSRWIQDAQHIASRDALEHPELIDKLIEVNNNSTSGSFEVKDHIDFCFTCMAKTLTLEQQVVLILKEVYDFKITEIMMIVDLTEGKVKHTLADARKIMIEIFESRCSLINKKGACYQCSELNGIVNPKQIEQIEFMKIQLVKAAQQNTSSERLFQLRLELIKSIDPNSTSGHDLYSYFLDLMPKYSGIKD